ncbi:hypothetical protein Angca_010067, partial [Angiostrongylus cantonensis]
LHTSTTLQELANELSVNVTIIVEHLKRTGRLNKFYKWLLNGLSANQKYRRLEASSVLLLRNRNDTFLDSMVTCNEVWIFYDD